jgi:arabinose-5-phosphate isomerase
MTSDPIVIESNELAIRAMEVMEKNRRKPVSILPVIADERVVGLIRLHSLVQVGLS